MPKHRSPRAPRTPFRPTLPHLRVPRVVVAATSLGCLTVAAFTVGLMATAGAGGATPTVVAAVSTPSSVPTTLEPVPAEPVATLDPPAVLDGAATSEAATDTVARALHEASAPGIDEMPDEARTAYERAAAVLSDARAGCSVEWTLLAAVGEVESDHGRVDGGVLDADGATTPARYGATLNGKQDDAKVRDTDAGRLDDHETWDRTVGPLNFLPALWLVVGVDADDDGRRDPQDIDDAALAAGVFLCSAERDLSRPRSLRAALKAFNPADGYVGQVLAVADAYTADVAALEDALADAPVVVAKPVAPDADATASDDDGGKGKDDEDEGKDDTKGQDDEGQDDEGQDDEGKDDEGKDDDDKDDEPRGDFSPAQARDRG